MKISRVFTTISLVLLSAESLACYYWTPTPDDNDIFRIVENLSPYNDGLYPFNQIIEDRSVSEDYFREENIKLWRMQTGTRLTDGEIRRFVYNLSAPGLKAERKACIDGLGEEAYRFLLFAKQCEVKRAEMNDPWYYPAKDDPVIESLENIAERGMKVQTGDKFLNRYVLQSLRALIAIHKDSMAVALWEKMRGRMDDNVIKLMAERHAAMAYRRTGKMSTAIEIYARIGDIKSLNLCTDNQLQIWDAIYKENPNSPFVIDLMQDLLMIIDHCSTDEENDESRDKWAGDKDLDEMRDMALRFARLAVDDKRIKNKAMWYYAAAALLHTEGDNASALYYLDRGKAHCSPNSFIRRSMRVLRMYIEAKTSPLNPTYMSRLARDMSWLSSLARRHITPSLKRKLTPHTIVYVWGDGDVTKYTPGVYITNKMYCSDAINRILAGVLAPRLWNEGKETDAILMANMGEFWLLKNVMGRAHSPNEPNHDGFTDHTNAMTRLTDKCPADVLVDVYKRLMHPKSAMDNLVRLNGLADRSFWCDMIGTRFISEHRYREAVMWLSRSDASFQKNSTTWQWFDRDPFCMKLGDVTVRRHKIKRTPTYKLDYARRMEQLQRQMRYSKSADKRGVAMVLYGVGLRNQSDWCWALSRHGDLYDMHGELIDYTGSKAMIDKGLSTIRNKELKAFYLHALTRNKEVMDLCPNTKIAKKLRARCDVWRDYQIN